jgi:hypothetical protein
MKRANSKMRFVVPVLVLLLIGLVMIADEGYDSDIFFARPAEAVVGRPATPVSVAGGVRRTSRRTSRRVSRRHAIAYGTRVTVLPIGYTTVVVAGASYHVHDGVYYQPHYEGNEVVYVVVEQP